MRLDELIPVLQLAIGPVILISGVGLVLLSMTNRFGRVIDRSRLLSEARRKPDPRGHAHINAQLGILSRRARLVRLAITLASLSILTAAVLIISLFLGALLRLEIGLLVTGLFIFCLGCLIGSLAAFLADINLSLAALKLEIGSDEETLK